MVLMVLTLRRKKTPLLIWRRAMINKELLLVLWMCLNKSHLHLRLKLFNAEVPMIEEADDVDPAQIPLPDDNAHDLESEDEKQPQNNDQDTEAPGVDQDEVVNEENAGPRRSSRAKAPVDYNVDNYYRSIGLKLRRKKLISSSSIKSFKLSTKTI
eukprot:TRINITY_DN9637_c0_g1_i5.p2 TRINITY_DN9637_c0_g1~~TRINITY_DN9637_c0_g1_i5.p2  ORF type:complete len:155 (+),score=50.64 TRINITY_DN9637_c0_g1_i5:212-676(+)